MSSTFASAGASAGLRSTPPVRPRAQSRGPAQLGHQADGSAATALRLTARGRLVVVLALLALVLALSTFVGSPAASTAATHHSTSPTVVVQPGQTLWDIAAEASPDSDPRDVVAQIVELNDLADPGAIRAGQPLYVPAG